jgi:hypothetical protein
VPPQRRQMKGVSPRSDEPSVKRRRLCFSLGTGAIAVPVERLASVVAPIGTVAPRPRTSRATATSSSTLARSIGALTLARTRQSIETARESFSDVKVPAKLLVRRPLGLTRPTRSVFVVRYTTAAIRPCARTTILRYVRRLVSPSQLLPLHHPLLLNPPCCHCRNARQSRHRFDRQRRICRRTDRNKQIATRLRHLPDPYLLRGD